MYQLSDVRFNNINFFLSVSQQYAGGVWPLVTWAQNDKSAHALEKCDAKQKKTELIPWLVVLPAREKIRTVKKKHSLL